MSEILNGNPGNVSTPLVRTVTALANNGSGAVRVTTSVPHLFGPSDTVLVATAAVSGLYSITIVDATHFDLVGSTYAATSTGTVTDLSLTPQVQVPTDGDTFSMQLSGMLSALQACLDRDQYLNGRINAILESLTQTSLTLTAASVTPAVLAVTSNGAPAKLQTSAAHGLQTGMWVNIAGATGDTAINGNWPIVVVDTTHFTIPVQGTGSYSASSATVTPIVPPGVNWLMVDGWGGGGGGEGGGGVTYNADVSGNFNAPLVQGGGGQGAPRTTRPMQVTPLTALSWVIGVGGDGGAGATSSGPTPAGNGSNGGITTVTNGSVTVTCNAGVGAGANESLATTVPTGCAVIAPGGHQRAGIRTAWPFATPYGYLFTATKSNIANFIDQDAGDGGSAVVPYLSGSMPNPSTPGIGQVGGGGGIAGTAGSDSGSSPVWKGGPGGGGGGAGPLGAATPGGAGGNGTNANHSGNSSNGAASTSFAGTNTGAGGGGGGTAGAASGTTGNGGAGAAGDSGQVTIYVMGGVQ